MANRLYVFCIGGTGSRVMRSLTMLLSCGVQCDYDIVPVIIDPDAAAGDLTRTVSLLNLYQNIHQASANDNCSFFRNKIESIVPGYCLPFVETTNEKFRQFVRLDTMEPSTREFFSVLFSKKGNLDEDMKVGFKGNPNMGTIVLNQFAYNQQFRNFCTNFKDGDKIFIISSIMGGTGSSGFPLLLKLLRGAQTSGLPNAKIINSAMIGAITYLPYFQLKTPVPDPNDPKEYLDGESFISKTRSALRYYKKGISRMGFDSQDNRLGCDALYYIGDTTTSTFDNNIGGPDQKNNAHFVEIAGALAAIDFAQTVNTVQQQTIHKEYGLNGLAADDKLSYSLLDLSKQSKSIVGKPLTQMWLVDRFVKFKQDNDAKQPQAWVSKLQVGNKFVSDSLKSDLDEFLKAFAIWLQELKDNVISFEPFDLDLNPVKSLFDSIKGVKPGSYRGHLLDRNLDLFTDVMIDVANVITKDSSIDKVYMSLLSEVTSRLVDQKLDAVK